jgi:NitT/TauT family transport system permease protein
MKSKPLLKIFKFLLLLVLFIALWQLLYFVLVEKTAVWKPYVFPSPLGVLASFSKLIKNGTLFAGIGQTMRRIGVGFGISILIGLFSGMLLARFKALSELLKPLVLGIQTLPSICWVPFAILWYGLAESATIFSVVIGSAFSICIAVETGIREINPLYIRAAKTMGAKGAALYTKVILPASVPSLVGALKQGWSFAWRALMTGEMMISSRGIGLMLSQAREIGGINEVTAVMLVIVLISILVDKLVFGLIEKRALQWAA